VQLAQKTCSLDEKHAEGLSQCGDLGTDGPVFRLNQVRVVATDGGQPPTADEFLGEFMPNRLWFLLQEMR
jgi:hypothetical protein